MFDTGCGDAASTGEPPTKAQRTRSRLLNTATALFRQRGYQKTTMRAIAKAAGLSLGASYYYFPSKEQLVEACYLKAQAEYLRACERILENGGDFRLLLLSVMRAKVASLLPYRRLTPQFARSAADPDSPLNPFCPASDRIAARETEVFDRLAEVSRLKISAQIRKELPSLLRVYQQALLLFWMHDRSPERIRTYRLLEGSADLIWRLIRLSAVPAMSPVTQSLLALCRQSRDRA